MLKAMLRLFAAEFWQCEDNVEEWFASPGFRSGLTLQAMVPSDTAAGVALDSIAALDRMQVSAASLDHHILEHDSRI